MVGFKELGTKSGLVANILVKNTKADTVENWMEWCTVAFRTGVMLCCHISTILAYGCTSSVFCYRDLQLRDFIQQRSLSFVALPGFFINELISRKSFWNSVNFSMSSDKEGSGFTCASYSGLPSVVSDMLWSLRCEVQVHSHPLFAIHDFFIIFTWHSIFY